MGPSTSLSGTVGETTLTVEQLASHAHGQAYSYGEGTGSHSWRNFMLENGGERPAPYTGGSKSHTHTLDGASGEADSLPPYYALAYIMRTA